MRPKGTHGCKPVEVVPGLYTAHYEDVLTRDALRKVSPSIKTVFNSAADKCPAGTVVLGDYTFHPIVPFLRKLAL